VTDTDDRLVGADRVVAVLTELADHPLGVTLDELAGILSSSKPTVHRALATLRRAGLADLVERGVYVLGDEYLRLAFRNLDGRPETARLQPLLEQLATTYGETAHYAVLSGTDIVYRAKMDPPQGAVRLTSVIGGRNPASRTAVGKALLASRLTTLAEVDAWFGAFPLEQKTPHTLTTAEALLADLQRTRRRGYGIDDQENEVGINCVAIPVHLDGSPTPSGAVSVSGVAFRCPLAQLVDAVPAIRATIATQLGPAALG
jgi:IclR family transcriptional regulator, acetate operon repressor